MRYVIVDLEGASRDYFSSKENAREAILELEDEAPGTAAELCPMSYDDEGKLVDTDRGDELLSRPALDWTGLYGMGALGSVIATLSGTIPPRSSIRTGATSSTQREPDATVGSAAGRR